MLTWLRQFRAARRRVLVEDALKHMHACEWRGHRATADSLAGALSLSPRKVMKLCQQMQGQGWLRISEGALRFTPAGEQLALQVIRAHRLWEKFLVDEARIPLADVHAIADRREHKRSEDAMRAMDAAMGYPATDPHGDPIPTAAGRMPRPDSTPLTEWPAGRAATIVHLEDEPKAVFSQIAAEGLYPGQRIKVLQTSGQRIVFADDQAEFVLAPVVAANVFVAPAAPAEVEASIARLTTLEPGDTATVHALDETLQGYTRRRMLDLGLTAGADIAAEYRAFLGDPVAFRVRGSLIALRRDQAEHVLIRTNGDRENGHG